MRAWIFILILLPSCGVLKKTRTKTVKSIDTTLVWEAPSFRTELTDISHIPIREYVEGGTITVYQKGDTVFVECDPDEVKEKIKVKEKTTTVERDGFKWYWWVLIGFLIWPLIKVGRWLIA